jgi:hypothetical protein
MAATMISRSIPEAHSIPPLLFNPSAIASGSASAGQPQLGGRVSCLQGVRPGVRAKAMKTILALLTIIPLIGCMSVPQTTVSFDPSKNSLTIQSPKDITAEGVSVTKTVGTNGEASVNITVQKYESKNNIEVLRAVIEQNNATLQRVSEGSAAALGTLLKNAH